MPAYMMEAYGGIKVDRNQDPVAWNNVFVIFSPFRNLILTTTCVQEWERLLEVKFRPRPSYPYPGPSMDRLVNQHVLAGLEQEKRQLCSISTLR